MELSPLTIYLLSILDSTRDALAVVIGILGFLFATSFFSDVTRQSFRR